MEDSNKKSETQLDNSTMRGFVQNLNRKLEKAGQPLVKMPSESTPEKKTTEYQVTFIKRNNKK